MPSGYEARIVELLDPMFDEGAGAVKGNSDKQSTMVLSRVLEASTLSRLIFFSYESPRGKKDV